MRVGKTNSMDSDMSALSDFIYKCPNHLQNE